jgi:zinc protease
VSTGFTHFPRERYRVTIRFGCDPERAAELTNTLLMQIDSLKTFGIEQSYLDKVYETSRRRHEERLRENSYWIQSLASSDLNGSDPKYILTGAAPELRKLRPEDIQETARTYLDTDRYARFVLVPGDNTIDQRDQ